MSLDLVYRNRDIILAFRNGMPMEAIAGCYGISKSRVHQILKRHGFGRRHGGARVRAEKAVARREAEANRRCIAEYGGDLAFVRRYRKYLRAYTTQRKNANRKNIKWGLSFCQWIDLWENSGKINNRGVYAGQYGMMRVTPEKGYVVRNVRILPSSEISRITRERANARRSRQRGRS